MDIRFAGLLENVDPLRIIKYVPTGFRLALGRYREKTRYLQKIVHW